MSGGVFDDASVVGEGDDVSVADDVVGGDEGGAVSVDPIELICSMCSTSMLPYRMVVHGGAGRMFLSHGVPSINLVGMVVIMAPLSRTAVGSLGPVVTS